MPCDARILSTPDRLVERILWSSVGDVRSRAIDDALFDWPAPDPALKASRCRHCGAHAFPAMESCRNCGGTEVEAVELPRRGTLWTWTVQRFLPKPPYRSLQTETTFEPFGVGHVELPGTLRIETRLLEQDPARLRIGAPVELAFYTQYVETDGTEVVNYAFRMA
ncbi:MAG: DNA-binding protein [Steroidobacteraceae bacterium]|nr:DNA-binding protein [Steroidobacteraceae bacterium]